MDDRGGDRVGSVTFFFPWWEVSGVPVLFARMARYLSSRHGVDVRVVDYEGGAMWRNLKRAEGIRLTAFSDGVPLPVPADTLLVTQAMLPYNVRPELRVPDETRLVYWTLYHLNMVPRIIPGRWFKDQQMRRVALNRTLMKSALASLRSELKTFIEEMNEHRSLFFMDHSTLTSTEQRLDLSLRDPVFVPVACDTVAPESRRTARATHGEEWSFAWVGRLADFKVFILMHFMARLSDYAAREQMPVCMHIVGEGPESRRISPSDYEHRYFRIQRHGIIVGDDLDGFLVDQVDVCAAMGTSALEAGKWGIPTVLLDAIYGEQLSGYPFRWLHLTQGFSLGELLTAEDFIPGNTTFDELMEVVRSPEHYEELANATFGYCRRNHSSEAVGLKLFDALAGARFRYGQFRPSLLRKGLIRRGYEGARRITAAWGQR